MIPHNNMNNQINNKNKKLKELIKRYEISTKLDFIKIEKLQDEITKLRYLCNSHGTKPSIITEQPLRCTISFQ